MNRPVTGGAAPAAHVSPPRAIDRWVVGARPRTLPAAVVPVAIGVGAAAGHGINEDAWSWVRAALALVVSLALQVAVNYANDYSDGVRGTDDARIGPVRLVASGLASPAAVKRAALLAFGVAAAAGLVLAASTSWWLLAVGAASIAAAWGYTGGPRPYGYLGLGELFVFVFFGLVATVGTTYVIVEKVTGLSVLMGCATGFVACSLLVVNNLRDIPTDADAGKRTLAVRLGEARTRWLYAVLVAAAFVALAVGSAIWRPAGLIGLAAVVAAVPPVAKVRAGARGPGLIAVLGETGRLQLLFGALTAVGLVLGA
jgi:1,4-dihydroxy-2-naphthoate octaprenyltransferase